MKILVTGGTGFVGKFVTRRLSEAGHEVLVLSRSETKAKKILPWADVVEGNPQSGGDWQQRVADCDGAINLAGTSIFTVWTESARKSILDSRILTTRNLVDALSIPGKDKVLINASAVGYYGSRLDDEVLDEEAPAGSEFMSEVCVRWEEEARRATDAGVRVALCRFGIVLGKNGGALSMMVPAFRFMLGGALGSGRQWMSWIHIEDLFEIFSFLLGEPALSGPINCTAPNPVRNAEFAKVLSQTLNRPIVLPGMPSFLLNMALGEFANVVVRGQRVIPKKLLESGFSFRFPTLRQALEDLIG
ncbi:MAG: TIGR01777 family oxidoreductase [Syntrophobacteraceae bacterium]